MMNKKIFLPTVFLALLTSACARDGRNGDKEVIAAANNFASAYFNYDFNGARPCVTPESERWLRFFASNVLEEDIELLKAQTSAAEHEVENISYASDTVAVAHCRIENYLKRDTLGRAGHVVDKDYVSMKLVLRNGRWLVDAGSIINDVPSR